MGRGLWFFVCRANVKSAPGARERIKLRGNRSKHTNQNEKPAATTSWDAVARWYDGWVGQDGSEHHREVAVPVLMELLEPQPGEYILDIGAGQGVLAPQITSAGAHYTGVDASPRMVE